MSWPARALSALLPLGLLVLIPAGPAAAPLPRESNRIVRYDIQVRLDPDKKQLEGRQRLTWRNPSADAVPDLWFHLYLNAFRNTRSTFFRESGGRLRGDEATDKWGWIDVTSLRIADGPDLTSALRFEHPDDDNAEDRTVASVQLPQPVPAGGAIMLEITFRAQLPEVYARSGYKGDFFLVGQWFPKLGVYEPAGRRGRTTAGWNCHQYHANSEFYADFGEYHVDITLPSRFIVGATGERTARVEGKEGAATHTFVQADVHDFAWTASPRYLVVTERFSATKDVSDAEYRETAALLGRPIEDVRLSDVEITLLLQPAHEPQAGRYIQAAKAGLKRYGLWYGRYPYRTLTVVDPPAGGGGAGGMEYPTFITGGTSWFGNFWPVEDVLALEMVTIHEFGHQFWYGLVANNEFEEAWLDEGINTYSTGLVMDAEYGRKRSYGSFMGVPISDVDLLRSISTTDQKDVIVKPAWEYAGDYSYYAYMKPAMALRTLEGLIGRETMARVMRTYHERWRFGHPSSADFFAVASEVAGRDLGWFFRQAFLTGHVLDYGVTAVSSSPVRPPRGVFGETGTGKGSAGKDGDGKDETMYESRVMVTRHGEFVFPVELAVKFEGKPVERLTWDGADRWKRFTFTRPERLEWARVDPDQKVLLDANWIDNARRVEPDTRLATSWASRFLFGVQTLLMFLGL
ncbi:MAG TPA: M1 family metallopeptidase [Vicinamibacterales bacterium]|nr:M1 family metallopeptidase [Vicinamibacterales bacterium]